MGVDREHGNPDPIRRAVVLLDAFDRDAGPARGLLARCGPVRALSQAPAPAIRRKRRPRRRACPIRTDRGESCAGTERNRELAGGRRLEPAARSKTGRNERRRQEHACAKRQVDDRQGAFPGQHGPPDPALEQHPCHAERGKREHQEPLPCVPEDQPCPQGHVVRQPDVSPAQEKRKRIGEGMLTGREPVHEGQAQRQHERNGEQGDRESRPTQSSFGGLVRVDGSRHPLL